MFNQIPQAALSLAPPSSSLLCSASVSVPPQSSVLYQSHAVLVCVLSSLYHVHLDIHPSILGSTRRLFICAQSASCVRHPTHHPVRDSSSSHKSHLPHLPRYKGKQSVACHSRHPPSTPLTRPQHSRPPVETSPPPVAVILLIE